jgi:YD repeat-containing protein
MTDGTGRTATAYGAVGAPGALRPVAVDGPLAGDVDKITMSYDAEGRLAAKSVGADNTETYAYDAQSRLAGLTNPLGAFSYVSVRLGASVEPLRFKWG